MTATAKDYAQALFSLAPDTDTAAVFADALKTVCAALEKQPAYMTLLSSPAIPKRERAQLLETAFETALPSPVLRFLQLMCQDGDMRALPACCDAFSLLLETAQQRSHALVCSAAPLSDQEQEQLRRRLEEISRHAVTLTCRVDPTLIGGVTVEMDGVVFDGSLKHRLHDMKEAINR